SASAQCYRGEMGKAALNMIAASRGVQVAYKDAERAEKTYDSQDQLCAQIHALYDQTADAYSKHNARMKDLRTMRTAASNISSWISGFASSFLTGNPAGAISAIADVYVSSLNEQMEQAQADFEAHLSKINNQIELERCYTDAAQLKYSIDV